ncbi:MAG TPA: two-component regulator propeller domain-containing protein [Kofleriaceae bacterium]|nr:two-component regulator propeller domain-containing protein [Kofleriaceae bacterium]
MAAVLVANFGSHDSWAQKKPSPKKPGQTRAGQKPPPSEPAAAPATAPAGSFYTTIAPRTASLRRRLRFQVLSRERGLPQNTVSSIVQDRTGFMWLGTADGLARYDGQRFLTFRHDPADPASLSASFVNRLLLARDGTIWVGTEGGGVDRYLPDSSTFQRFAASDAAGTLKSGSILSMSEGPDGRIWVGTNGGGLAVLDPATGKVRSYSVEDGLPPVVTAVLAVEGVVWVGTGAGLYRMDVKAGRFEQGLQEEPALKSSVITVLRRDKAGDLWIGTGDNGLARFSAKTAKVQIFAADPADENRLLDSSIKAIYQDRAGHMWIGTEKALHLLDPATGRFERSVPDLADSMSLPGSTMDVFEDTAGVIWVGTLGGGAALLDPRSPHFNFYKTLGATAAFYGKPDLWLGTSQGLCRWRGEVSFEGTCYDTGFVTSILVDRAGTVWVGTMADGLFRLNPGEKDRWIVYKNDPAEPRSIAAGPISRIHQDTAGRLWLGLIGGGLQRFEPAREEFSKIEVSDTVYMIKNDPKDPNVLWIGTADLGVISLQTGNGEVGIYTPNPGDVDTHTDNAVADFAFDGDRTMWLATYGGGLKRLDRPTRGWKTYRRSDGMPSDTLYAIRKDRAGRLWMSSTAGLARLDPRTQQVRVYTTADGLQSDEFSQLLSGETDDGRFFFGGVNGLNVFRPEAIDIEEYRAPLVLTSIKVLDQPAMVGRSLESLDRVRLRYDEPFAAIDFAALSFSGSNQYAFEYKVDGLNDRWFTTSAASVNLTGLDDGDYTVHIRARNRHGAESAPISLGIEVTPPPWRTWWAYSAYALATLILLGAFYRYQQGRIDRLQKMARLATVEKEFELTAAVQSWFLPEAVAHRAGCCDLVGFYRGAEKCSGDWWWYEDVGRGQLWVIVADVTGHGAGPAMLTAAVAMGLSVQSGQTQEHLLERLGRVNREVLSRCKGKATMTMTALLLDQDSGQAVVYGMGGLPAVVMGQHGEHKVVGASGTPIGSVEQLSIGERSVQLAPGDRLILTTDGIVDTTMRGGRQLGMRRFVDVMRNVRGMPLQQAVDRIVHDVDVARGGEPQEDDFTFCMLERRA